MSGSGRSGAQSRAAAATSQSLEPGLARSKSMRATAFRSRKMTLSRFGSLWLMRPSQNDGGGDAGQTCGAGSKVEAAWWYLRSSPATLTIASSVSAQVGYGGTIASPGMED